MQLKIQHHALTINEPPPPGSKKESEKKTDWMKMAKGKAWRQEHDAEVYAALAHPWFFEEFAYFGGHVFDEPPEELKERVAASRGQKKGRDHYKAVDEAVQGNVLSFLEQFEKKADAPPDGA